MIIESKKLFFRSVLVLFEDDKVPAIVKSGKYSKIVVSSYHVLDLPGYKLRAKTTALIHLRAAKDEIFSHFNDTTRNEIRKTYKNNNLRFQHLNGIDEESYNLYKKFEYSQRRLPVSRDKLRESHLFGAYFNGELVSAIYVFCIHPYLRIRSIFSKRLEEQDKEYHKIISNSSRRLVWEICQWGKQNGFSYLDMASVNFKNPQTANITKFKMSFGGSVAYEYTYSYVSKPYQLLEKIVKLRKVLFALRRKS